MKDTEEYSKDFAVCKCKVSDCKLHEGASMISEIGNWQRNFEITANKDRYIK